MSTDLISWLKHTVRYLDAENKSTWAEHYVKFRRIFFQRYQQGLIFSTVMGADTFHTLLALLQSGEDIDKAVNYTKNINAWLAWARTRTVDLALNYVSIESAPEDTDIDVQWGCNSQRPEFGSALRLGSQWYITSESNPHANHRPCATPTGWYSPKLAHK